MYKYTLESDKPVVIISLEQFEAMKKTIEVLSNPELVNNIRQALSDFSEGKSENDHLLNGVTEVSKSKKKSLKSTIAIDIPSELASALSSDPSAADIFEKIPPSHKREYINYINEAKKPETRIKRAQKTLEMLKKG